MFDGQLKWTASPLELKKIAVAPQCLHILAADFT